MRALLKVGFGMLVLAFLLIGASYSLLKAHGYNGAANPGGRMMATETRSVGKDIDIVELSGPIDLQLRYGGAPSLEIRGEQRMLNNVDSAQDGHTLHIGTRGILLRHNRPLQAILVLPSLASLSVNGSGDSVIDGFSGERIEVQLSGSGSVNFNGRYRQVSAIVHGSGELEMMGGTSDKVVGELVGSGHLTLVGASKELRVQLTGSGDLDAQHLRADAVTIKQMGSGNSTLFARQTLAANLSGSGDVDVYGNPGQRSITRTGSGDVSFSD